MTSTPWAFNSFARAVTAIVAEGGTARALLLIFIVFPVFLSNRLILNYAFGGDIEAKINRVVKENGWRVLRLAPQATYLSPLRGWLFVGCRFLFLRLAPQATYLSPLRGWLFVGCRFLFLRLAPQATYLSPLRGWLFVGSRIF